MNSDRVAIFDHCQNAMHSHVPQLRPNAIVRSHGHECPGYGTAPDESGWARRSALSGQKAAAILPHNRIMTPTLSDTTPAARAKHLELLRQASPARKLEMMAQLNATVRTFALAGLRQRYPQASDAELRRRLADLLLGPELASQAYGPLVSEGGHDQ